MKTCLGLDKSKNQGANLPHGLVLREQHIPKYPKNEYDTVRNVLISAYVQFYTVSCPPVLMTDPGLVPLCFWPPRQKLSGTYAELACPSQAGHKNIDTEGWSVIFVCLTFEKSTGAIAEVIKQIYREPAWAHGGLN